jgi:hypothetical protein
MTFVIANYTLGAYVYQAVLAEVFGMLLRVLDTELVNKAVLIVVWALACIYS